MDAPEALDRTATGAATRGFGDLARAAAASRPVRFLVVGVFNTLFGYSVFALLTFVTHQPPLSLAISYVIGAAFNYFTTGRLVFAAKGFGAFLPFVMGYVIVLAVNLVGQAGLHAMGVSPLVNQAVLLPFVVVLSYVVNRYVVFSRTLARTDG